MEPISTPAELARETDTSSVPWGLFIGLVLILAVIVGTAFYSFSEKYVPSSETAAR